MRLRFPSVAFAVCSLLLLLAQYAVQGQNYAIQYTVQVSSDGSAAWTITQVSDLNGTIDTWDGFQEKILSLVDTAASITQREMSVDPNSLEITTFGDPQTKTTRYMFTWLDFSAVQDGKIIIGDVFLVNDFYMHLYGDGTFQLSYPPPYTVQTVSPTPNQRDDSLRTLEWLGTQFFPNGEPSITLATVSSSPTTEQTADSSDWQPYVLIGLASAAAVSALLAGFYAVRRRRRKAAEQDVAAKLLEATAIESEEQKIVKILRANGGSSYQSAITERLKFSKAKTSQLLTALEKKGVVRRYKKGRDKIVTLAERGKSEQQ
jgi:uncharacterized membrane protein